MLLSAMYWYCYYPQLLCSAALLTIVCPTSNLTVFTWGRSMVLVCFVMLWDIRRVCECK